MRKPITHTTALILGLVFLLISTTTVLAATLTISSYRKGPSSTNSDDYNEYITLTSNDVGGTDYNFEAGDASPSVAVGTIKVVDGYMYVLGYKYTGTGSVNTSSLSGWEKVSEGQPRWGARVVDTTRATYSNPCGSIEGYDVSYFTRTYYGCTSMSELPLIPATALNTDEMCGGCTSLEVVVLSGTKVIGNSAFKNCSNLKTVFIGSSVTTINAANNSVAPFAGVSSTCKVYCEVASKPAGYGSSWDCGVSSVEWDSDYAIVFS